MKIIKGKEKHIQECLAIATELHDYFTKNAIAAMKKDMRKHLFYVVVHAGKVHGFATIFAKSKGVAEISWMAIKKECERLGFGTALMNHIVSVLKSKKIRLLEVKTLSENVKYPPYQTTHEFYKKMGFILVETIDPYPAWDAGNPCAMYIKIL